MTGQDQSVVWYDEARQLERDHFCQRNWAWNRCQCRGWPARIFYRQV